ncbi:hypothetical protein D910_07160 [Dendroctonus ponderosae]|uniref:Peptidase S1 domain-containing protein n=1 Tax=Dendroctonus ponderosae TaxID=77166 RepID=U4U7C0_DENPD|nr:hypothetical protein D910_07160 [Dendroctonus ponderosae]
MDLRLVFVSLVLSSVNCRSTVGIIVPVASGGSQFCGASLINTMNILTAAHCVDVLSGNLTAYLGAHNMLPTEAENATVLQTDEVVVYPLWNRSIILNDIALIHLKEPVELTANIQPIEIPEDDSQDYAGETSLVTGWGRPSETVAGISPVLNELTSHVMSNYPCRLAYLGYVEDSNICMSSYLGNATCSGDSGGPLTVDGVQTAEELASAVPAHLELDPEFRKLHPNIPGPSEDVDSFIVGGVESTPHSRRYQVGIYIPVSTAGNSFCGGSLINARTVVTAAHCVDIRVGNLSVYMGAHNMPPGGDLNFVARFAGDVVIHEGWNRSILLHDIALIRFEVAVPLSASITPVLLPRDATNDYLGNIGLVTGWGRSSDSNNAISPVLREVTSSVISNYACRLAYTGIIEESHICISGGQGRGTCNGDSGGPLVANGVLVGVVSFGSAFGCETADQLAKAIPGHLELDPEFRKLHPSIPGPYEHVDPFIVGGVESTPHSRQYQVGIYTPVTTAGISFCGGTLINARTVVTAAHCVDLRVGNLSIFMGAHNMPPGGDLNIVARFAGDVVIHEGWNRSILLHDIALVRFEVAVPLSASIIPILLPRDASNDYLGNTTLVSGWGRASDSINTISPVLREVTSWVISNYACRMAYLGIVQDSHICISGAHGRGTCNGDSGGPLVVNGVLVRRIDEQLEHFTAEQFANAVPGHLELDPEFRKLHPNIPGPQENVDPFIVGGVEAIPHSRPYQVAVYSPITATGFSFCGGSLINARTVITAAHCVDRRIGNLSVFMGAHNMPPGTAPNVISRSSDDVLIHEGWNRAILLHDIAIVRFETPVPLSANITPVLLPRDATHDYLGNTTLVTGWGRPSDSINAISPVLREVTSWVISNYACRMAYLGTVQDSHICISGAHGRGTCQGDSGGPLVINGALIGVVSFGSAFGCEMLHYKAALGIINGDEVVPHSLPYMAALQTEINGRTIRCGGSLIEVNKVLTAASCVYGASSVTIKLGAHNLEEDGAQVKLNSSVFTIHQDFDPDLHLHDIAIVHLEQNVTLNDSISTISTPPLGDILLTFADDLGMVAGWGKINDTDPNYSNVLRKIEMTIIPFLACTIPYLGKVQTSQICTTGMQNGKNICLGDSGSPLVVNGTQVGIASYGSDLGCSVGAPGVFTRLTSYYFWLLGEE